MHKRKQKCIKEDTNMQRKIFARAGMYKGSLENCKGETANKKSVDGNK